MERIESLVEEGLSEIGRKSLMNDVHNLLDELTLVRQLESFPPDDRFDVLENRLRALKGRIERNQLCPS